jgi:hypothetical protein
VRLPTSPFFTESSPQAAGLFRWNGIPSFGSQLDGGHENPLLFDKWMIVRI